MGKEKFDLSMGVSHMLSSWDNLVAHKDSVTNVFHIYKSENDTLVRWYSAATFSLGFTV